MHLHWKEMKRNSYMGSSSHLSILPNHRIIREILEEIKVKLVLRDSTDEDVIAVKYQGKDYWIFYREVI